jgi:hypothetical protein
MNTYTMEDIVLLGLFIQADNWKLEKDMEQNK